MVEIWIMDRVVNRIRIIEETYSCAKHDGITETYKLYKLHDSVCMLVVFRRGCMHQVECPFKVHPSNYLDHINIHTCMIITALLMLTPNLVVRACLNEWYHNVLPPTLTVMMSICN